MSVKEFDLIPTLVEGMNKVNMKASASKTKEVNISVLDFEGTQMILKLTTIRLDFKGETIE